MGGASREEKQMDDFRLVLEECQLQDVSFFGPKFTWERGNLPETNIRERFDRGVAILEWMNNFSYARIQHLPYSR